MEGESKCAPENETNENSLPAAKVPNSTLGAKVLSLGSEATPSISVAGQSRW
jgi:hypothetical protein